MKPTYKISDCFCENSMKISFLVTLLEIVHNNKMTMFPKCCFLIFTATNKFNRNYLFEYTFDLFK